MKTLSALLFVLLCLFVSSPAFSQSGPAPATTPTPQEMALSAAIAAAQQVLQPGPHDVPLAGQASLSLPAGYGFVPAAEAGQYLKALGNIPGDALAGLVVPLDSELGEWFAVVEYIASGYIRDDDAREWDADALLASLRAGTEASNEQRAQMGIPALEIIGWVELPQYDADTQRLVWSIASRSHGQPTDADNGINYNTYALGREGYFSLNLVTAQSRVAQHKPAAHTLLTALQFDEGKRYADFNPDTDTVAEYGLAALVAGVAAKKLGLLATLTVFLAKFWKLLLMGVVGVGYAARKWFGKKSAA